MKIKELVTLTNCMEGEMFPRDFYGSKIYIKVRKANHKLLGP